MCVRKKEASHKAIMFCEFAGVVWWDPFSLQHYGWSLAKAVGQTQRTNHPDSCVHTADAYTNA